MTKFSNKFKKPCFWPILGPFSQFWGEKIFLENPALSCTTSYGFLAPCENLEKVNNVIQRKHLDRQKDGRTDRPYLIGPFQLPLGVQHYCKGKTYSTKTRCIYTSRYKMKLSKLQDMHIVLSFFIGGRGSVKK